ncbi:MAG: 6-phosphofructokinase [Chloroflexi bacterium]|nr:6-phosphofructokinase [Chloroflexota bacterium]MCC6894010.1 6-phosphofructokinase [Anaerolineae bacterium]
MKTLLVVSGGDAPGINNVIGRYLALAANGDTVIGADGGFPGLLSGQLVPLTADMLIPWMGRGGSILASSRDPVLNQQEAADRIRTVLSENNVDNILLFGGNGTLRHIPPLLKEWGIPCIGLPTTIDNDVPGTEMTLGFDSACNFAYHAIDGAQATAHALRGRIFLVETLGGTCGNLALAVAHGAGAHAVILPEYPYDDAWLAGRITHALETYGYAMVVICEGARGARTLMDDIPKWTGTRVRDIRLGHAQRGGVASHRDRVLAADMAQAAYTALKGGTQMGIACVAGGKLSVHEGVLENIAPTPPDPSLYNRINGLI